MVAGHAVFAQDLVRVYKQGPRALDGVDLSVSAGEIYGFLGPNGAGKSTTVRILTTLLPPSSGEAWVGGYDVVQQGPEVRRVIGTALQEAALDPLLTGRDHFVLQAGLHGLSQSAGEARARQLLERVGLLGAADRRVGTYSGGMRRRLDLALALVHDPRVIFLDEPTTGLDPQSRAALWDEVRRLAKEEGATVFLTTQYLEEADALADRVGIIDHGRIVAEGTPAALKAEIGRPTVIVAPADPRDASRIQSALRSFGTPAAGRPEAVSVRLFEHGATAVDVMRALDAAGVEILDVEVREPSLDDVFLEKTGRSLEGAGEEAAGEDELPLALELEEAIGGRSRVERAPTALLKAWLAERRAHAADAAPLVSPALSVRRSGGDLLVHVTDDLLLGREGVDVALDDAEVSRRHAAIRLVQGSLVVEDLGSLNGTWVNGARITAPTLLAPGDVLTLGKTQLEVRSESAGG